MIFCCFQCVSALLMLFAYVLAPKFRNSLSWL